MTCKGHNVLRLFFLTPKGSGIPESYYLSCLFVIFGFEFFDSSAYLHELMFVLGEVCQKLLMATPTKASPSMHSVCFNETLERGCSKTTEQNSKRFFASGTKFWQTAQICKKVISFTTKIPKNMFPLSSYGTCR
jgi:hypothetical protein